MKQPGLLGPIVFSGAGDFPLLPGRVERTVQLFSQRLQSRLKLLPDHVDLGIVSDGLERDVGHAFVDETFADVPSGLVFRRDFASEFRFLLDSLGRVGQQVVGYLAAISRVRASARATRLVSQVIQRRPHCSAT